MEPGRNRTEAFLVRDGRMVRVSDLLWSAVDLAAAVDINNRGEILCARRVGDSSIQGAVVTLWARDVTDLVRVSPGGSRDDPGGSQRCRMCG